jgi:hypothetical protein
VDRPGPAAGRAGAQGTPHHASPDHAMRSRHRNLLWERASDQPPITVGVSTTQPETLLSQERLRSCATVQATSSAWSGVELVAWIP